MNVSCDSDKEMIIIEVVDTGIGISEDEIGVIFNAFTQADTSTTRKYGGTGLGLTISKQLAKKLGGDITVISQPGSGSQFTLTVSTGSLDNVDQITSIDSSPELKKYSLG